MQNIDSGLYCLILMARFFDTPTNPENLRHELAKTANEKLNQSDILRSLKRLGIKSTSNRFEKTRLDSIPTPAILEKDDGTFVILARVNNDEKLNNIYKRYIKSWHDFYQDMYSNNPCHAN